MSIAGDNDSKILLNTSAHHKCFKDKHNERTKRMPSSKGTKPNQM